MSSIFKSGIFSEKQCGSVDDHEKQEAQSVVQDPDIEESQVDLQEGCKDEQSVEDQFDEPHEVDDEDVAEEDRAGENLKCDNLINIYVCADDNIAEIYMRDTRNGERKQFPIKPVITFKRARISVQAFHHWGRNEAKIHHYLMEKKVKMKPHPRMNKYGLTSIKTKMKTLLPSFYVLPL